MRKKCLSFLLAIALVTLGACSNNASAPTITPEATQPTATAVPTAVPTVTPTEAPSSEERGNGPATPTPTVAPTEAPAEPEIQVISIAEALELCGESGNITEERYYIRGTVEKMINATYGNMVISDSTGSITVYGTYSADGSLTYSELSEKAFEGDEVLLHCILQNYNGTKEVKNARLIEFIKVEVTVDESLYPDMTISEIRTATEGTLAKTDGVVAAITYANGMVPNGVILVDETQSIYVFDSNLAQQVSVGNHVTVLGTKTYWILEKEMTDAAKFGYQGCCQLTNSALVANDNGTHEFDKTWIPENTVKAILDNPVSNDITTTLYKVNALVKKAEGTGFTNYYFYDIDETTGSYTYTQCNGSDFAWLDAYDGKICTVYLTALNAKSSASGCVYRFYPVAVFEDGFTFDTSETAEHVVNYYGIDQFQTFYSGDPALALITDVSSEMLGFSNATLSYTSDATEVLSFETTGDITTMHCLASGTATVTVTGSYEGTTFQKSVTITVDIPKTDAYEYGSVADAISANVGDTVTIKGIVGPSLVNKDGFYFIDESGMIAVLMDTAVLETVEIGHEIILQGTRDRFHNGKDTHYGQTCVTNCQVIANNYGSHEYSTATFDSGITLADFYNLDPTVDYSTKVFILKATITVNETAYYTNIDLYSGDTKVSLYCANANQYNWLKQFAGQEVTLELAPCNWNNKTYYRGCVLAVYTDNGKEVNTLNFQK